MFGKYVFVLIKFGYFDVYRSWLVFLLPLLVSVSISGQCFLLACCCFFVLRSCVCCYRFSLSATYQNVAPTFSISSTLRPVNDLSRVFTCLISPFLFNWICTHKFCSIKIIFYSLRVVGDKSNYEFLYILIFLFALFFYYILSEPWSIICCLFLMCFISSFYGFGCCQLNVFLHFCELMSIFGSSQGFH